MNVKPLADRVVFVPWSLSRRLRADYYPDAAKEKPIKVK